jgi:acetylornithine deacetylase
MHEDETTRFVEEFIGAHRANLINFTRRLIAAPSVNPPGDERAVASLVMAEIEKLGLGSVTVHAAEEARPNLICVVPGAGQGPVLMLNGHMDTKPPGDLQQWHTDPFDPVIKDGLLYGLGACDMKGAVAAMTYAGAAVRNRAGTVNGMLKLVYTADEEYGSTKGASYLVANVPLDADACLIGEPSGIQHDWEAIHLVSRGVLLCRVKVHGTQMHSSLSDSLPSVNASEMMARLLVAVRERLRLRYPPHPLCVKGPTINPGVLVQGGVMFGVVPGYAEFAMDIRCIPGMTLENVRGDLEAFVREEQARDSRLKAEVVVEPLPRGWMAPSEIPMDHPLVVATQWAASQVLGAAPPLAAFPGGTDAARFQGEAGIVTIPSFGPGLLSMAHCPNEYVPVESVVQAAKMYALATLRYLS